MQSNTSWTIRRANNTDVEFILEVQNENRIRFTKYYPSAGRQFIERAIEQALYDKYMATAAVISYGTCKVGYIWLVYDYCIMIPTIMCKSIQVTHRHGKEMAVQALKELINYAQNWATERRVRSVQYDITTGDWKPFQKLLERTGAEQIGVIMERTS